MNTETPHRLRVARPLLCASISLVLGLQARADDWPQFLGPERNGISREVALSEDWPDGGPRVVWQMDVGDGFSGPVVADGRLILFHRLDGQEVVEALDAQSGESVWNVAYPTRYRDDFGFDEGPRAVPVVVGGVVYTFGAEGQLRAIDLQSGDEVWSEDTMGRFGVPKGFFGAAGSPVVVDRTVIANIGGRDAGVVAFDANTGEVRWTATDHGASYSSGIVATIAGSRTAVFLTRDGLVGIDPETGLVRFERPWRARQSSSVNVATPLVIGDLIFVSAEYGPGAGVFRVDGSNLVELWASDEVLSNHYATSVHHDGVLYGFHGRQEFGPSFRAVDLRTGTVFWSEERFRGGTVTLVGDRLLVLREGGELMLAEASPEDFRPLARAQVLPGTVRAYPALADGLLYVRNDNMLVCLDLRP